MREKMALLAVIKAGIMFLLLAILFLMLWKGISIYEEKVWMETQGAKEVAPVLREVVLVEDFDIENQDSRELFAERVTVWENAERLVRSADSFTQRNNIDQAIARCQDALRVDPSHIGALERLGALYFEKGMNVESINSYLRLLGVDPSRADLQEKLIEVLGAHGDFDALIFMARWYHKQNQYDEDVQRFLANALFQTENYEEAAEAYTRVLKDAPKDVVALEQQVEAYMMLKKFEKALVSLELLRETNYRDKEYYHNIAICHAQLGNSVETVQTLGKAAHLFGQKVVIEWIEDPMLHPVREDRTFQAFADRVGGEEFRKWLEQVARTMETAHDKEIEPQLELPDPETLDPDLLKVRK